MPLCLSTPLQHLFRPPATAWPPPVPQASDAVLKPTASSWERRIQDIASDRRSAMETSPEHAQKDQHGAAATGQATQKPNTATTGARQ